MRRLLVLLSLAACSPAVPGVPALTVGVDADQRVTIELRQEPDHVFTGLHATISGIDAGQATVSEGDTATATFAVPIADLQSTDVEAEVEDNGDAFAIDVPGLLATRRLAVDMGDPLHAGDTIAIASGVATDTIAVSLYAKQDDAYCVLTGEGNAQPGLARAALPGDLAAAWQCGAPPVAGSSVDVTIEIPVTVTAPIARCTGPNVTCAVTGLPQTTFELPATLQF